MKYKIYLLFLLSLSLTSCHIYKKHFDNNQDYTTAQPGKKLKTTSKEYPLNKNNHYKIPKISEKGQGSITDFAPPEYSNPETEQVTK